MYRRDPGRRLRPGASRGGAGQPRNGRARHRRGAAGGRADPRGRRPGAAPGRVRPGAGRWHTALLADGNIGIGGHPERLLARVGRLLAPAGAALVELAPPGTPTQAYLTVLEAVPASGPAPAGAGDVAASSPFRWAEVSADDIGTLAEAAGLRLTDRWRERGRYFARLERPSR
jgi:hypothetical protein